MFFFKINKKVIEKKEELEQDFVPQKETKTKELQDDENIFRDFEIIKNASSPDEIDFEKKKIKNY